MVVSDAEQYQIGGSADSMGDVAWDDIPSSWNELVRLPGIASYLVVYPSGAFGYEQEVCADVSMGFDSSTCREADGVSAKLAELEHLDAGTVRSVHVVEEQIGRWRQVVCMTVNEHGL